MPYQGNRNRGKETRKGIEVREGSRKGDEYLYVTGRTMEKGKSGVNAFIRHSKYEDGGFSVGLAVWGGDQGILNFSVPEDCIELDVKNGEFVITFPIVPSGEFDDKDIQDWLENKPEDRGRDDDRGRSRSRGRDDDEDENEDDRRGSRRDRNEDADRSRRPSRDSGRRR